MGGDMSASPVAGIDLGTTNSLIGVMDAGFPILLADADGRRLTPSTVHFPAAGEPVVGAAAERLRVLEPEATVYSVKRYMGRRMGEESTPVPYPLAGKPGAPVRVALRGREWAPEEISALVLRKLKADAEHALGQEISRAVITVPAYFNDAQRNATKAAGEMAGFTVERILNEPTAAALAYGLNRLDDRSRIAVFDLGGGTFDISLLELNAGVFQVLATSGNTRLGGDDIDAALVEHLRQQADLGPEDAPRLREAAIAAKHRLSEETEVEIAIPFLRDGRSLSLTFTRAELEQLARPIVERTRTNCLRALTDARLAPEDLDEVILVGGQTRMPLVRRFVQELFRREPNLSQNPDEAVALGATIQAGILSGAVQEMTLLDVTPLSLGIETFGGLMNVIIPRNSTIPCKAGEMFTNAVAGQRSMLVRVMQGEREMVRDNWELGRFELEFQPAPKGQARLGVQFEIDASDEAVEKMLEESLEHAFEDVNERVFTEAKIKATELLPAVRNALARIGPALPEPERELIIQRTNEVETALAQGAAQPLKKATAALDEATQHLAALLIEQATRAVR
jgi:molecular chaperone DnaK